MESEELARLKGEIAARYGSIYAFAKDAAVFQAVGMARGTLYQVLNGRYAGNLPRQAAKIKAALELPAVSAAGREAFEILKQVACGRCRRKRPKARQCGQCLELWQAQAAALEEGGRKW